MTILNRPSDGLYNVLISIYKVLDKYGSKSKEELKSLLSPGEISDAQVTNTLNRWIQLGLFAEDKESVCIRDEYARNKNETLDDFISRFPFILRDLIFLKKNNDNFWNSSQSASADFSRGMSWLLAQDVYSFPTNSHDAVQKVEISQLIDPSTHVLQNNTRWNGLCHWATYLGFAWWGRDLVIDPTVALRENLPRVFGQTRVQAASKFLKSTANFLPVLDFGAYRQDVENALNPANWIKPPKFHLSTSLSRAIKRLEVSGDISLEYRSDAGEAYHFLRQNGEEWGRPFTHIAWNCKEGR